ncbi:MAG: hypothetical protein Kow0079_04680 [Vicingaceae bacterium]
MKRFTYTLILIFIFSANICLAQKAKFICHFINEAEDPLNEVVVNVYKGNDLIIKTYSKKRSKVSLDLEMNAQYTIELVKEGYITKRIGVDTKAKKIIGNYIEPFEFMMEMIEIVRTEDVDFSELDFPVALIKYYDNKAKFDFVVDYTKEMKEEQNKVIKKMYAVNN